MKKNKTVAYMLAATLLVGGTFLGTKALFTDKLDSIGELAISTGDVDIEVTGIGTWTLTRNGVDLQDGTSNINDIGGTNGFAPIHKDNKEDTKPEGVTDNTPFANNLKMGDVLTKTVTVENKGTLNAVLDLKQIEENGNIPEKLKNIIELQEDYTVNHKDGHLIANNNILEPGETATVTLTISLKEEPEQLHNSAKGNSANDDGIEDTVINLTNRWELSANQVTETTQIQNVTQE